LSVNLIKAEWTSPDGQHRILLGDCLEILPTLEPRSADAIVTDPPYAVPTIVASGRNNTSNLGDLSLIESVFRSWFTELARVIGDSGRAFVFCDGTSYPVLFRAVYGRMNTALLVWAKNGIGMGREFRKSHELILHAWSKSTPVFSDGVGRSDVLKFPTVQDVDRDHPAQKPVELIEELLRPSGQVILDPFAGSCTVAVACARTGRRSISIEIERKYFDIGVARMERELARHPLLEPPMLRQRELMP